MYREISKPQALPSKKKWSRMAEPIIAPKGDPWRVNVHDFEDKKLGKVVPYGVYDVTTNAGFVSVGITSDTAEFVVRSTRCWREY
jgi:hypothetical protein